MKQNVRKVIGMVCAVAMAAAILAGCGTSTGNSTSAGSETSVSSSSGTQLETQEEKPVKLTWYVFGVKQPDHDLVIAEINKKLKSKINAELDLQVIESGVFNDKMKMIVTSGDNYDITFTASWKNNYYDNVSMGAFLPLDDLINTYAPTLKTYLPSTLLDVAKVNGKTYAVPNQQILYTAVGVYVQKELLDKYKFDLNTVKSFMDLEPFLENIKTNEPNLIPYRVNYSQYLVDYEAVTNFAMIKKGDKTLKIIPTAGSDAQKDAWNTYFKGWFKKGYIRKDALTVTDDSADLKANKFAVLPSATKPGGDAAFSAQYGKEYVSVSIEKPYLPATAGITTMNAISTTSKNPDRAIKLIELVNTDKEIYNNLLFGIENTHYTKISNDTIEIPKESKYQMGSSGWMFGNQFNALYMKGQESGIWDETDKLNKSADVSVLLGFTLDQAPIQAEIAKLTAVDKEYSGINYTPDDFEKRYTEYVEKMKKAGLDTVVAEIQAQVDKWAAANGKK